MKLVVNISKNDWEFIKRAKGDISPAAFVFNLIRQAHTMEQQERQKDGKEIVSETGQTVYKSKVCEEHHNG